MEAMAMGSFWVYEESIQELKSMLLQTTFELETVRREAKENMKRNEENVKQLLYFLKEACQERDEARGQLQKLLNKLMPRSPAEICPVIASHQPESPMYTVRGNSSITVSDNISETYTHQSYGSSPVDSLLDMVQSPDLTNINMADSSNLGVVPVNPFLQEYNCPNTMGFASSVVPETDRASVIIDNLVKGKTLPEKGKLMQTIVEAGPLLQTLLQTGSLPQWRNPPPLKPIHLPPFSINGCETETNNQKPVLNLNHHVQSTTFPSLNEFSYGSSQMYSGTCLNKGNLLSSGVSRDFLHSRPVSGKRQRCQ